MDLLTTATPPPTLSAAEPRRLRNDFEDFFGTRRPQLIRSAEIALPLLTSWDLLAVDKPADARSRSAKSTEQVLAETTRPCPRCFIPIRRAGGCVHMTCGNPRSQPEFCWLCLHDRTRATHDASFCTGRAEASHSEVLPSVERHRSAPIGRNRPSTRGEQRTLMRKRYFSASAWHSPHVLKATRSCFRLRCRCAPLLEFYDHSETQIRATAQVVFADVPPCTEGID